MRYETTELELELDDNSLVTLHYLPDAEHIRPVKRTTQPADPNKVVYRPDELVLDRGLQAVVMMWEDPLKTAIIPQASLASYSIDY